MDNYSRTRQNSKYNQFGNVITKNKNNAGDSTISLQDRKSNPTTLLLIFGENLCEAMYQNI